MNGNYGYPVQQRVPSDQPPPHDPRRPPAVPPHGQPAPMSRAERFEDEKRRMIESCFSKVDANGQLAESYITHIRVQEDAAHPSSPPPPNSPPTNKKARVIVIAVKSSGRVRMHKARENNNSTFSIGKTWNLEDLSAIECYTNPEPMRDPRKEQMREWAGSVGFLVTILKPYYWQAGTSKEKDFFIASLVKIFRKYTKGRVPELKGFTGREVETILGLLPGQPPPRPLPSPNSAAAAAVGPPRPPFAEKTRGGSADSRDPRQRMASRDQQRPSPDLNDPPARRQGSQEPTTRSQGRYESPNDPVRQPKRLNSKDQGLRQIPSHDRLARPSNEQVRPQPSRDAVRPSPNQLSASTLPPPGARVTPKSSNSELHPPHTDSPAASSTSSISRATTPQAPQPSPQIPPPLSPADRQKSYQSVQSNQSGQSNQSLQGNGFVPPKSGLDATPLSNATVNRWKPSASPQSREELSPQRQRPRQAEDQPRPLQLREQPPVSATGREFSYEVQPSPTRIHPAFVESTDLRPAPLSSSRPSTANSRPPTSTAKEPEKMPGAFFETPPSSNLPTPQPQKEAIDPIVQQAAVVPEAPADSQPKVEEPASMPPADPQEEQKEPFVSTESDEAHRPGLGPMFKKKDAIANRFRSAANAYNAFKPRAGGAGERLAKGVNGDEPSGMNAVVPAPLRKMTVDTEKAEPVASPAKSTAPPLQTAEIVPEVEVTSPVAEKALEIAPETTSEVAPDVLPETPVGDKHGVELRDESPAPVVREDHQSEAELQISAAPEPRRPKRRTAHQDNYLRSLDIDPRQLDGRGIDFENILTDFGWGVSVFRGRQLEDLEADLKRELGRVEAGSWLGHIEQKDDRVDVVDAMLDRAIAECDELEGLLTLYAVELGSLNDDIAFIEAQSQGLQVQTANQKILHAELSKLVDTISLTPRELQPLRHGDLTNPQGIAEIESSLLVLYKAMVTIDPSIRSSNALSSAGPNKAPGLDNTAIASMLALQEKRRAYLQESAGFCQRLLRHLDTIFDTTLQRAKPALRSATGIGASPLKLNGPAYSQARDSLWQYSPLILFTKEINQQAWQSAFKTYYAKARPLYNEAFRNNAEAWKKGVRKTAGEASELLFTSVEKETPEGLGSTARRITVKRSQTIAKTFRAASGDKVANAETRQAQTGHLMPCEVFAGVLEEQIPLLGMEQGFIVGLFHATSLENIDFADAVMAAAPAARTGQGLGVGMLMEPDRSVARQVSDVMEEVFGFWSADIKALMEWAISSDPIQAVGVLTTLSIQAARLQETSQEYALYNLTTLSQRLTLLFQKFVDEQIRAIEDTKVKIKKRKGVIAFMKIFPPFSAAVENTYHATAGHAAGTSATAAARHMIDEAYVRINKAMWDSLKVIARESPTANAVTTGHNVDPEDKEILNYHILLIENMHHYIEDVDDGGNENSVLAEWKGKALMDRAEHMEEYVGRVVRRPLGKALDFLEAAEALLAQKIPGPSIAARPTFSRSAAKKIVAAHDSKEIRRSIETLRKRIEKHFGESDEEQLSRQLVVLVCKECERRYDQVLDRLQRVCQELYKEEEKSVVIEWTKEDNRSGFQ